MILIDKIDNRLIEAAIKRSKKLGILNNSITNGSGNVAGYLGQMLVALVLKGCDVDTYGYDVVKDNIRYEVKTKRCTSEPMDFYNCSVANYNTSQKCDYYVFVRILEDYSKAWILGKKTVQQFYSQAIFNKKGEIDTSSNMKWKFRADCYNLEIKKLDHLFD